MYVYLDGADFEVAASELPVVEVLLGHGGLLRGGVAHPHPAKAPQIGELNVLTVHPKHGLKLGLCVRACIGAGEVQ